MFKTTFAAALVAAACLFASGCASNSPPPKASGEPAAFCQIAPAIPGGPSGRASFSELKGQLHVEIELEGLSPGLHGIHLHENGDCSNKAAAAGGHFNPDGHRHGMAEAADSHAGDFGNIQAKDDGKARLVFDDPYLSLDGSHSVVGRSLVVHADADDMKSQPAGNSGTRIACGIVYWMAK